MPKRMRKHLNLNYITLADPRQYEASDSEARSLCLLSVVGLLYIPNAAYLSVLVCLLAFRLVCESVGSSMHTCTYSLSHRAMCTHTHPPTREKYTSVFSQIHRLVWGLNTCKGSCLKASVLIDVSCRVKCEMWQKCQVHRRVGLWWFQNKLVLPRTFAALFAHPDAYEVCGRSNQPLACSRPNHTCLNPSMVESRTNQWWIRNRQQK
jgi:hypothetical protein